MYENCRLELEKALGFNPTMEKAKQALLKLGELQKKVQELINFRFIHGYMRDDIVLLKSVYAEKAFFDNIQGIFMS